MGIPNEHFGVVFSGAFWERKKVSETKTHHANIAQIARNARIATIDVPKVNY